MPGEEQAVISHQARPDNKGSTSLRLPQKDVERCMWDKVNLVRYFGRKHLLILQHEFTVQRFLESAIASFQPQKCY